MITIIYPFVDTYILCKQIHKIAIGHTTIIVSETTIAKQLGMTQPGVGYAANREEKIAKENNSQLID